MRNPSGAAEQWGCSKPSGALQADDKSGLDFHSSARLGIVGQSLHVSHTPEKFAIVELVENHQIYTIYVAEVSINTIFHRYNVCSAKMPPYVCY